MIKGLECEKVIINGLECWRPKEKNNGIDCQKQKNNLKLSDYSKKK